MADSIIPKRKLGSTKMEVSILSFGTVKIGRNHLVKNKSADGFDLPSDSEIKELLDICIEHGINLIDTAPAYGIAEERLGSLLGTSRKDFYISTKAGEEFDGESSTYNFSKSHILNSVERSLRRLNTDYIDSVLIHCPREDLDVLQNSAALETLSLLKDKGDILNFGASTNSVEGGLFTIKHCDIAMVPFNKDYQEHLPVIEKAEELNKGILIKKGLLSGFLNIDDPVSTLKECFNSAYTHPSVGSLVAGTINKNHLRQNIDIVNSLKEK